MSSCSGTNLYKAIQKTFYTLKESTVFKVLQLYTFFWSFWSKSNDILWQELSLNPAIFSIYFYPRNLFSFMSEILVDEFVEFITFWSYFYKYFACVCVCVWVKKQIIFTLLIQKMRERKDKVFDDQYLKHIIWAFCTVQGTIILTVKITVMFDPVIRL